MLPLLYPLSLFIVIVIIMILTPSVTNVSLIVTGFVTDIVIVIDEQLFTILVTHGIIATSFCIGTAHINIAIA